jgi:hypothetical protein
VTKALALSAGARLESSLAESDATGGGLLDFGCCGALDDALAFVEDSGVAEIVATADAADADIAEGA